MDAETESKEVRFMASDNSGANFLVGFFVGAAIGVMGALLLAPKSGKEMRESLAEGGRKLRDKAMDEGRRFAERSEEVLGSARDRGEAAYQKTREGIHETTETAKKAARGVKEALTS
jgi:gas vesicle protein